MESPADRFTEYLERHKGLIYKAARAYCSDPEERKDLVQDIVSQLWRAFPKYNPAYSLQTWTYRIAINVSISYLRKTSARKKARKIYQDEFAWMTVNDAALDENLEKLYRYIERLKPVDKALAMLYLDSFKNDEIAAALGLSLTNVSTKKQRIREELKTYFLTSKEA